MSKTIPTKEQFDKICISPKVRRIAVENIAINCLHGDYSSVYENMSMDKQLYHWNGPTWTAMMKIYNYIFFDKKI